MVRALAGGKQLAKKSMGLTRANRALHTRGGCQGPCMATDSVAVRIQLSAAQYPWPENRLADPSAMPSTSVHPWDTAPAATAPFIPASTGPPAQPTSPPSGRSPPSIW